MLTLSVDLALSWSPDGADLVIENGDLSLDDTLLPAVLVSLFSDGRAPTREGTPVLDQDLRGYWGEESGDPYGSLLWTLWRDKATRETAARARESAEVALAWLVSSGIARSVEVEASYIAQGVLLLQVRLARGSARRWASLWATAPFLDVSWPGLRLTVGPSLGILVP